MADAGASSSSGQAEPPPVVVRSGSSVKKSSVLGWHRDFLQSLPRVSSPTSGALVPSPYELRDAFTKAAEAQLAAAQQQSVVAATRLWSTLAGNGAVALEDVLAAGADECLAPQNDLHLLSCEAALVELHAMNFGNNDWLRSTLGRTLLSKGPLSVLPGSRPATSGGVLLVGTRRLELSKDNFVLRCLTTQGRYVISMNEKHTLALLLPARTPVEELAALDAALACITNLASDLQLDGIQEHLEAQSPRSEVTQAEEEEVHGDEGETGEQPLEVDADGLAPHEANLLAAASTSTSLAQVAAASTAASIGAGHAMPPREAIANAAAVATALRDIDLLEHVETDEARVRDAAAEVSGVAARIAKGGELVADAVVKSKDFAAQGMHLVGSLVKTRVAPPPPSRRAVQVGPATKKAIQKTQRLTEIALEGSKLALSTAAYTFKFVGTSVSASVQETRLYHSLVALAHRRAQARAAATAAAAAAAASGERREVAVSTNSAQRMLSSLHQAVTPSLSPEDVHKAKMVAGTVLTSCLGVYRTCKAALWEFTDDLRDLTTDLTEHYYGADASSAAGAAFDSVRNVGTIMLNVDSMPSGPSNVAFTVAKESSLDILALDEWLSGAVLAHGYIEAFSPIATWMPQWMLLRSSALLVYNVRTGKATRPVEVVTVADITGAWAVSAPSQADAHAAGSASGYDAAQSASCSHFEVSTQELSYRLRVRSPAMRQQWLDAILTAVAAHKKLAPKVVLSEQAESFVNAEQATLEAWKDAVQAHITQWEEKLGIKAAKAAEAADSWATLQAWASQEAATRAAEAAAEVSAFVSVIPSSVEARLPVDASAQLARARDWANTTLAQTSSSGLTDPSALLNAAEQHMRQWLAENPRLCSPEVAIHAIGAAAGTVVDEALHVLERPPPGITADVLSTAAAWAESAEAVFSPSTAYAQRRLAQTEEASEEPLAHKSASAPAMAVTSSE